MADEAQGGVRAGAGIPTKHQLRAALQSARVLDRDGETSLELVRHAYTELPTGGLFHSNELIAGERLLVSVGLIEEQDDALVPTPDLWAIVALGEPQSLEELVSILLQEQPPLWLSAAAADGEVSDELIPDDEAEMLDGLIPDLARREAMLLAAGRRHEEEALAALGLLGEEHVVEEWQSILCQAGRGGLTSKVWRASKRSDQLGWDVDGPTLAGDRLKLEVKTTRTTGPRIRIHLSRNEVKIGNQDSEWRLVACRADEEDRVEVIGWCTMTALGPLLPTNQHSLGAWETAVLMIDTELLVPGFPPLG